MINVDNFLLSRFPDLPKHPFFFKGISRLFKHLFHENEFHAFEKKFPHLRGMDFVDQALRYFDFSYSTFNTERERIPKTGRVVIISNHPIGSLDGLALLNLVSEIRKDVKVVANDVLSAIEPLRSLLLAVDNMGGKTAKENIKEIYKHLEAEGAVIIFPAGVVSRVGATGIKDGKWNSGFLKIASKTQAPILPVFVEGRNSAFFYSVSFFAKPFSTLLLVDEMFKQSRKSVQIRIGNPIRYQNYNQVGDHLNSRADLFKDHVYNLQKFNKDVFSDLVAIAHPEDRLLLLEEIKQCKHLGETSDGKVIYLYKFSQDSSIMREIGRLREVAFRSVGEGTGKRRDADPYDVYYDHIVLWDNNDLEIVGSYRVGRAKEITKEYGVKGLYSARMFDYHPKMNEIFEQGLELGRSFVQPKYWGKRSLDYLWYGIGAYVQENPDIRYLFGAVSISNDYNECAKATLVYIYNHYFTSEVDYATAVIPFNQEDSNGVPEEIFKGDNYKKDFSILKNWLANQNLRVPTLYKQYFDVCEQGGVKLCDFSIDPAFSNCVDALVIADLNHLKAKKRQRYMPDSVHLLDEDNEVKAKATSEIDFATYSLGSALSEACSLEAEAVH